jgi:hypothetical protein
MRTMAQQQLEIADAAAGRFPGVDVAAEESSRLDSSTGKELGAADKPTAAPPVGPEHA